MWVSAKFRPARVTRISLSPGIGSGTGSSASLSTSGPPNSVIWIARMAPRLSECVAADGPAPRARGRGPGGCSKVPADAHHRGRIDRL